jgi:hypothetical protein
MALLDKLNFAAKVATEKANEAIGSGKLAVKIKKEEYNIAEQYQKIGEYYYQKRTSGTDLDPEVDEFCLAIDLSKAAIAELEEQMKDLKTPPEVQPAAEVEVTDSPAFSEIPCPVCGGSVPVDAKFCGACGAPLDE